MPLYQYECPDGHVTEVERRMSEPDPGNVQCQHTVSAPLDIPARRFPGVPCLQGDDVVQTDMALCLHPARRVYTAPAAIHFRGPGFYSTDVKARQERKRRPNPGDDLYVGHDRAAAQIARSL